MAEQSLAVKYRPKAWDDVTEQGAIKTILQQQLATNSIKNAYLFCGGAGTGKTTCARIFANEINKGQGNPIEMDAASNNSVEDVRDISKQAQTKSLDSEYKIFIIDECHALSNTAWQAMLKLIEEPPTKSIFIFATTDPQKIPKTILSRVQRYDFQRISHQGIVSRLNTILHNELSVGGIVYPEAIDYIAKIADGGMRDSITLLDKCLAYSTELTLENVLTAIGDTDHETLLEMLVAILEKDNERIIKIVEEVHQSGKDLKQFVKSLMNIALDVNKYSITNDMNFTSLPNTDEIKVTLDSLVENEIETLNTILKGIIKLNADVKWDTAPKALIQAELITLEF